MAVRPRQGPIDLLGRPCRRPFPHTSVRSQRRRVRVWPRAQRRTPSPLPDVEARPARPSLTAAHERPASTPSVCAPPQPTSAATSAAPSHVGRAPKRRLVAPRRCCPFATHSGPPPQELAVSGRGAVADRQSGRPSWCVLHSTCADSPTGSQRLLGLRGSPIRLPGSLPSSPNNVSCFGGPVRELCDTPYLRWRA